MNRPTPAVPVVTELRGIHEETPTQQQARISASSATRELDELMASLSDFKVQSNVSLGEKEKKYIVFHVSFKQAP